MKKVILILLAPIFMATQCESDDIQTPQVDYVIQNNSNTDLIFISVTDNEFVIQRELDFLLNSANNEGASPPLPSQIVSPTSLNLYKRDPDDNLILAYEQDPIIDSLWVFEEISEFESRYTLTITDDLVL